MNSKARLIYLSPLLGLALALLFLAALPARAESREPAGKEPAWLPLVAARLAESDPALAVDQTAEAGGWGAAWLYRQGTAAGAGAALARPVAGGWQVALPGEAGYAEAVAAAPDALLDPAAKQWLLGAQPAAAQEPEPPRPGYRFPWPEGGRAYVTQNYQEHGEGQIDFYVMGDPVTAAKAGKVVYIYDGHSLRGCRADFARYNNVVVVQHAADEYTLYLHLAQGSVPNTLKDALRRDAADGVVDGAPVARGELVGRQGATGYTCGATGVHIHLSSAADFYTYTAPDIHDEDGDGDTGEPVTSAFARQHRAVRFDEQPPELLASWPMTEPVTSANGPFPLGVDLLAPTSLSWLHAYSQPVSAAVWGGAAAESAELTFFWRSEISLDWVEIGRDGDPAGGWTAALDTSSQPTQTAAALRVVAVDADGTTVMAELDGLGIERTPPTAAAGVEPRYRSAPFRDFLVEWRGEDAQAGVATYDVEARRDGGVWEPLLAGATETRLHFIGEADRTYSFRVRAVDRAGNVGSFDASPVVTHTVTLCPTEADAYEPDGGPAQGAWLAVDGPPQLHNFDAEGDVDWVRFRVTAGATYRLLARRADEGGLHSDTVLELYDGDGATLLAANDDFEGDIALSRLDWVAPADGQVAAALRHYDLYGAGCTTHYTLELAETAPPPVGIYLPLVQP